MQARFLLVIGAAAGALPQDELLAQNLKVIDDKVAALVSRVAVLEEERKMQTQTIASQQLELAALRVEPSARSLSAGDSDGRRLSTPPTQRSLWHESIFHKFDVPDSSGCGLYAELHNSIEPLVIQRKPDGNLSMQYSVGSAFSVEAPFTMTHPTGCTKPTLSLNADTDVAGTLTVRGAAVGGGGPYDTDGWISINDMVVPAGAPAGYPWGTYQGGWAAYGSSKGNMNYVKAITYGMVPQYRVKNGFVYLRGIVYKPGFGGQYPLKSSAPTSDAGRASLIGSDVIFSLPGELGPSNGPSPSYAGWQRFAQPAIMTEAVYPKVTEARYHLVNILKESTYTTLRMDVPASCACSGYGCPADGLFPTNDCGEVILDGIFWEHA